MIEAKQITIGYHAPLGLPFNLTLQSGHCHVIIGPNGSGKTTLFKTLIGLIKPQSGVITVNGSALNHLSTHARAHLFAYVPQSQQQPFPYTAEEMVLMGRTGRIKPFSVPGQLDLKIVKEVMEHLEIGALAQSQFTELSGGQRQMTLIARALAQEAQIIVLDEPTSSLDFGNEVRVLHTIERLTEQGLTVIVSTHNPAHALQLADTVTVVKNGSVSGFGLPRDILTAPALTDLYETPVRIIDIDGLATCIAEPKA